MEQKLNKAIDITDIEIIKKILSEKENDAFMKEKLYRVLYEASSADEADMDTDLIDECVKAIDLIEGKEQNLSEEKIKALRQGIDRKYEDWLKSERKIAIRKRVVQVAACFLIVFFTSSVVANAFGYNLIQSVVHWGQDTFNLSSQNQPGEQGATPNITERKTYGSMDEVIKDISPETLLPEWVPDGFTFQYSEKYASPGNNKLLLYFQDTSDRVIIFDLVIYDDERQAVADINFEKDENLVEVYEIDDSKHYILSNLGQIQAVWSNQNTVYNINGDVSAEEIKEIIRSMYR